MKINNLKYSIWQFIFSLIFTIPTLIGTIICFKENDLLFSIIYLLVFIIALIFLYFSIKDIQWFEINSNSIIVKNIFGVIKKIEINNIKKAFVENAKIFSLKMLSVNKMCLVISLNKTIIKADIENAFNKKSYNYIIIPYNEVIINHIANQYNLLTGNILEVK